MSVEIRIMSGTRAGQVVLLDNEQFRAGGEPGCELFFDSARDPAAAGHVAWFQHGKEGWLVRNVGAGQIWLNAEPVVEPRRVRSGDVVRMSEEGPDFSLSIVARPAGSKPVTGQSAPAAATSSPLPLSPASGSPLRSPSPPSPRPPRSPSGAAAEMPRGIVDSTAAAAPVRQRFTTAAGILAPRSKPSGRRPTIVLAAGMVIVATALLFVVHGLDRRLASSPPPLRLKPIARKTAEAGRLLQFPVELADPAYWDRKVHFGFGPNPPSGAVIDGESGDFSWTPEKAGGYTFVVEAVALDGSQQRCDTVVSLEVASPSSAPPPQPPPPSQPPPSPPPLGSPLKTKAIENLVGPRAIEPLKALRVPIRLEASGTGKAAYALGDSPRGARVVLSDGVAFVEWTPQPEDAGKVRPFSVRVTDGAGRSDSVSFNVEVRGTALAAGFVVLLQVEQPQLSAAWAFGTGVPLKKNVVLTSGQCGQELERLRKKGFKVWATHESGPLKLEVAEVRVPAGLLKAAAEPRELRCFDLAMLVVKGELPKVMPLATAQDMAGLNDGCPLTCLGYSFNEGQRITPFFQPADHRRTTPCEVFKVLSPHGPTGPRAIDLKANISESAFGSALLNVQGRVVGIYAEPAPKDLGIDNLHYATALNGSILQGLDGQSPDWLPPVAEQPEEPPKDSAR